MTQYPKYPAYQDSGVEWLGQIPSHWGGKRIKYIFTEINERSDSGDEDLLSVSQYIGVTRKSDKHAEGDLITNAESLEGYKKVKKGDLVSNIMLAWNGSLGFSPFTGITSPAYSIYRVTGKDNKRYLHYLLRTDLYKSEFKRNSSGVIESRLRLYSEDFFDIRALLPPLPEQTAIANFLDDKTAKIDRAIAQKERLIALLKERKQILIQNAVTKGLDPTAKMKDSGIEWIGEIPEHWEVRRAKYLFFESDKRSQNGEEELLSVSHLTGVTARSEKSVNMFLSEDYSGSKIVQSGDVVYNVMWAWMGALGVSETEGIVSPAYGVYRQWGDQFHNVYLEWLLQSGDFRAYYNRVSTGLHSSRLRFYPHMFMNMHIIFPSLDEQRKIVEAVQKHLKKMDGLVNGFSNQIQTLREYRATLIDSAVTGKIDIREHTHNS